MNFKFFIFYRFENKWNYKYVAFTFSIYVIYFISFKLSVSSVGLEASHRTSLNLLNLPKRVIKFYLVELQILIKNSGFLVSPKIFLMAGVITLLGFLVQFYLKSKSVSYFLVLVLILPFCYAPNILSSQSYFSLRAIPTTAIIVLFYQFCFLRILIIRHKRFKPAVLLIPILLLLLSGYNQKTYLAGLQHKEYTLLKNTFQNFDVNVNEQVTIIRPEYRFLQHQGYLKNGFSDEFGNLSSVKDWVPNHLFCQIKWEEEKTQTLEIFPLKNIDVVSHKTFLNTNKKSINLISIFKNTFDEK